MCSLWVADSSADLSGSVFRLPVCLSVSLSVGGLGFIAATQAALASSSV